jgi:hypothetical protein
MWYATDAACCTAVFLWSTLRLRKWWCRILAVTLSILYRFSKLVDIWKDKRILHKIQKIFSKLNILVAAGQSRQCHSVKYIRLLHHKFGSSISNTKNQTPKTVNTWAENCSQTGIAYLSWTHVETIFKTFHLHVPFGLHSSLNSRVWML